jgi:hypothetical protein
LGLSHVLKYIHNAYFFARFYVEYCLSGQMPELMSATPRWLMSLQQTGDPADQVQVAGGGLRWVVMRAKMRRYQRDGAVTTSEDLDRLTTLLGQPPRRYRDFVPLKSESGERDEPIASQEGSVCGPAA